MADIRELTLEPGFITIRGDSGPGVKHPMQLLLNGMTNTYGTGSSTIRITDTYTQIAVAAHKSIRSELTYAPATAGTACPIAIVGKLTLDGDLTNAGVVDYPGMGWGVQGQIHVADEATIDGTVSGTYEPGAVYCGVRGVMTDGYALGGTGATYTRGILSCFYGDIQMSEDCTSTNFKIYGMFLYVLAQGGGRTGVDAMLMIDESVTMSTNDVDRGAYIRCGTTGIEINKSQHTMTTGLIIGTATTGINLNGAQTTGIVIGSGVTTGITSAAPILIGATGSDRLAQTYNGIKSFQVYTTCASTSGSNWEPQRIDNVATGEGQVGCRFRINLLTNVRLGAWANAFKAQIECNTGGGSTGTLSVGCFEMVFPKAGDPGVFTCLELEATTPATGYDGVNCCSSYIFCNCTGTQVSGFQDNGALFHLDIGNVAGTGNMVGTGFSTVRCRFGQAFGSTDMYIPMSSVEESFTTAYPIYGTVTGGAIIATTINANTLTVTGTFSGPPQRGTLVGLKLDVTGSGAYGMWGIGLYTRYITVANVMTGFSSAAAFEIVADNDVSECDSAVVDVRDNMNGSTSHPGSSYIRIRQSGTQTSANGRRNLFNFNGELLASLDDSGRMLVETSNSGGTTVAATHLIKCNVPDGTLYLMATTTAPQA